MEDLVQKQLRILLEKKCVEIFHKLTPIIKQNFSLMCFDEENAAYKTSCDSIVKCLSLAVKSYKETGSFVNKHVLIDALEIKKIQDIFSKENGILYSLLIGDEEQCIGYMASINREDASRVFVELINKITNDQIGIPLT